MLLTLDDKHKKDVLFVKGLPPKVIGEFCKIALTFIKGGSNPKIFGQAAEKLGVELEDVQHGIEGIAYLLTEASRLLLNEIDFIDSLLILQFDKELAERLKDVYMGTRQEIRDILTKMSFELPAYDGVEWRLDLQMGSRTAHSQMTPVYVIKLKTKNPENTIYLQTDYANLKHTCQVLEGALKEMRSAHYRRIARNIK
mmetsp:Transcript_25245/g.39398  ORF Transcript_25245/g.39398 Transcript_25245/m.39398 type:complete len:198 (-) Transcript_25245:95-688(-)|eukprot:CAMPEP_0201520928 /NCGR_PEP_ID=MMETSP0161_2-20130828/13402_1 /ASSEMBLY_ACC=CAM_ASM_000251 /TAXON_ID=180227 /ORGANISM="Neoparamoeba aestuarina, Strain SoJaBio B1-5/56/2" /LENGTH=197 /DNA_ID=CAMNT_0047919457 /DNA_START=20 /DNA_END=613 /DNA_ORIENTATION=+